MSLGQPGANLPDMRVLCCIRLSHETDETTSPERQRAGLIAWAEAHGHTIVGWAEDIDVSGDLAPEERPGLGPWLTDNPPVEFDVIASTKIDRLSRNLGDFVDLIEWTGQRGKYLVAYMDSVDTSTPTGELVAKVLAIFAEFERKAIAARTRDSYELAIRDGRWHGGTVPYGYFPEKQPKGEGWRLVPDPESSKYFREIMERFIQGTSLSQLAAELNDSGLLPPHEFYRQKAGKELQGTKWSGTSLRLILRSRAPLGVIERHGEVVRGPDGLPVRRAEPIISRAEWDKVQARLDEIAKTPMRTRKTSPLLRIAFCIECGQPLYRQINRKNGIEREYYRCRGWRDKLNDCRSSSLSGKDLHEATEQALLSAIGDFEVMEEVYIPAESHTQELVEATEALTDLLERSAGKHSAVRAVYQRQIDALEAQIERLSALPEAPARKELRPSGSTYRELWEVSNDSERRWLLTKAGVRIEAGRITGENWIPVPRYEREVRDDQAVLVGAHRRVRFALYVPRDILERSTRQPVN